MLLNHLLAFSVSLYSLLDSYDCIKFLLKDILFINILYNNLAKKIIFELLAI